MTHVSKTILCTPSRKRHPIGYQDIFGVRAQIANRCCSIRTSRGARRIEEHLRRSHNRKGVDDM